MPDAPHKRRELLELLPAAGTIVAQRPPVTVTAAAAPQLPGLSAAWAMALAFAVVFFLLPNGD